MTEKNDAAYSGPLSPEEKAECDRELEEMHRETLRRIDRDVDEYVNKRINERINERINNKIFSVMD